MKVIVFGGSGFIGSHVSDVLSAAGNEVVIYDIKPSPYIKKGQLMVIGDILDQKKVEKTVQGADVVYNFAGVADMELASQAPLETLKYNILGNSIILEAAKKAKVKRFIFASSLYVYSKSGSFYRSTKQACELIIENYYEIFGLPYTILRYGSLYGPRSDEKNFMHKILKQALHDKKIVRDGDGEEIREYIHVCDAAKASVDILSEEFKNECVIITGTQQMKVKELLLMIKEMLDNKIEIEYRPSTSSYHYELTPYTFAPKLAKRLINNTYFDLGQGVLQLLNILSDKKTEAKSLLMR